MCFSNLERKILDEMSIEEQEKWIFEYDDNDIEKTFTDQKFIEKVWYACVRHGYIAEDYDVMGKLLDTMRIVISFLYVCMVNTIYLLSFVETPRKFIIAELSIRKLESSSVLIIISTDEDPSLRIESSAIINLRGVSTKLNKYDENCVINLV